MPLTPRHYRFRIWDGTGNYTAWLDPSLAVHNLLVATTTEDPGDAPFLEEPQGDGQELDVIACRSTVGAQSVRIIDAQVAGDEEGDLVASDGFEYEDVTALEAAHPETTEITSYGNHTWSISSSVVDSAPRAAQLQNESRNGNVYRTIPLTGLTPNGRYRARMRVWQDVEGLGGILVGIRSATDADYYEWAAHTPPTGIPSHGFWVTLAVEVVADGSGNAWLRYGFWNSAGGPFSTQNRLIRFDTFTLTKLVSVSERALTRRLADIAARWQGLSLRGVVEWADDDTPNWETLRVGYVNSLSFVDALAAEIEVGDTTRTEQQVELFREAGPPRSSGGVLESPSCIIGGPIAGSVVYNGTPKRTIGGAIDYGPARYTVVTLDGAPARQVSLEWVGGYARPYYARSSNAVKSDEIAAFRDYAKPHWVEDLVTFQSDSRQKRSSFGYFPGLVVRLRRVSDGAVFYRTPIACVTLRLREYVPGGGGLGPEVYAGDPDGLIDPVSGRLRIDWPDPTGGGVTDIMGRSLDATADARPSNGDTFDVEIYPLRISEESPWWERGHPVDLLTQKWDAFGEPYDTAAANSLKAALNTAFGGSLVVELRHTKALQLDEYKVLLGAFFGFASRVDVAGAHQLFGVRVAVPSSGETITADDLASDAGSPWSVDESTIVTRVEVETEHYARVVAKRRLDDFAAEVPLSSVQADSQNVIGKADESEAGSPRSVSFKLPGRMLVDGVPLDPISSGFAGALGTQIVDWVARGLPTIELHVLPSITADVGDRVTVDLPHIPVPVLGATPVTQRGQAPITARVVKRTPEAGGAQLVLVWDELPAQGTVTPPDVDPPPEEDPLAEEALVALTLARHTADPVRRATVTISSAADLADAGLQVALEYAVGPVEPTDDGDEWALIDPAFQVAVDTPVVAPGSKVWVRGQGRTLSGVDVGAWSAWASVDLAASETVPPPALSYEIDGSGNVTVTATLTSPAAAVRIVAGTVDGAAPTEAEVLLGTLLDTPPFEAEDIATLVAGERVVISAIAEDADGRTSSLTSVTVVRGAAALEELDPDPSGVYTRASVQVDAYGRIIAAESGLEDGIPAGGTTGQALLKASDDDFDAEWADLPSGGGGGWQTETRAVAQPIGSYSEIAEINIDGPTTWRAGTVLVALHIVGIGYSATALYVIPMEHLLAGRDWEIANPLVWGRYDAPARGGRLEVRRLSGATNTLQLRAVQTGGFASFTAIAQIQVLASTSFTITALSGTGSSTASRQFGPLTPIRQTVRRALGTTVGSYVEIGSWSGIEGGIVLRISVTLPSNANKRTALTYIVAAASDTPTGWREVPSVAMSTPYSNRQTVLEADVTSGVLSLRLRHSAGSFSGDHIVVMEMLNLEHPSIDGAQLYTATPQFTPSAGTGTSGVTATTTPWDIGDRVPVRNVTAAYTASTGDRCIIADTTSAGFTIALPAPNTYHTQGQVIRIKNKGSNNLTLDPAGSAQIDGATTKVLAGGASVTIVCTGTDWQSI